MKIIKKHKMLRIRKKFAIIEKLESSAADRGLTEKFSVFIFIASL